MTIARLPQLSGNAVLPRQMRPAVSASSLAEPAFAGRDPASPHVPTRLGVLAWGAALIVLTLGNPSTSRMLTWPWAIMLATIWTAPVALVAWHAITTRTCTLPPLLVTVGLGLLGLATLGAAMASPFAGLSVAHTWPTLGGTAFFLLLHAWLSADAATRAARIELVGRIIAGTGAVVTVASLTHWIYRAWPAMPTGSRNEFPFGHSNYTAGFTVLVLPWLAWRTWTTSTGARVSWAVLSVLALATLGSTSSRGGMLAIATICGFAGVWVVARAPWTRRQKALAAAGALIVAAAIIVANPRLRNLVLQRHWGDAAVESNRQRSAMLRAGWQLGVERPLLGWGPGTVPLAYPHVRARLDGGVDNVLQLHNTPMQLWATGGGIAVFAAGLLGAGLIAATYRQLASGVTSPSVGAAAASTAAYGLFTLSDHQLDVPIFAVAGAINAAILCSDTGLGRVVRLDARRRLAVAAAVAGLAAVPVWALLHDLMARRAYEQAVVAWEHGQGDAMLAALDRATALTPTDAFFQHHAAAALLAASDRAAAPQRLELRRAAVARLEVSRVTHVHEEFARFNLGWLQLELGAPRRAVEHFRAAAALVPDKGGVYFGLGLAWQQLGAREAAVRAFALEWLNDPRSAFAPIWETPAFAALRPAVHDELLRLFAQLRRDAPAVGVAENWMRWWWGEIAASAPPTGFTDASATFAASCRAIDRRETIVSGAAWAQLYEVWRRTAPPAAYLALAHGDREWAAALARRAGKHGESFRDFLVGPTDDEPALLRIVRRQRIGYGVLASHPDGPLLPDVYVVQENRLLADFAAELFPAKGWLPGRFLLALLPPDGR